MKKIESKHYPVFFGQDIWGEFEFWIMSSHPSARLFMVTDENVMECCFPALLSKSSLFKKCHILTLPAGEESKDISKVIEAWQWLTLQKVNRNDLLINFGGGMITDLGGFVAGTYKRGMPFVNIPTSLIGFADASVGGKTGVNFLHYKNQAGLFANPQAVFTDPSFLKTLPERDIRSGIAEIIKLALVYGMDLWDNVRSLDLDHQENLPEVIYKAIKVKIAFTDADPYDIDIRKCLNLGHTLGHALEGYSLSSGGGPLSHGEAVAMGIIAEALISSKVTELSQAHLDDIVSLIKKYFPEFQLDGLDMGKIIEFARHDKKNRGNGFVFTLLEAPGSPVLDQVVPETLVIESLEFIKDLYRR